MAMVAKKDHPSVFIGPRETLVREEAGKHIFDIPLDVQPRWA